MNNWTKTVTFPITVHRPRIIGMWTSLQHWPQGITFVGFTVGNVFDSACIGNMHSKAHFKCLIQLLPINIGRFKDDHLNLVFRQPHFECLQPVRSFLSCNHLCALPSSSTVHATNTCLSTSIPQATTFLCAITYVHFAQDFLTVSPFSKKGMPRR